MFCRQRSAACGNANPSQPRRPRRGEKRGLVERTADQLKADRQTGTRESARQGKGRLSRHVKGECQIEERTNERNVLFAQPGSRHRSAEPRSGWWE